LRRVLIALQAATILLAAGLFVVPLPPALVERYYADGVYPSLQGHLTAWSNTSRFSLFDVLVGTIAVVLFIAWGRWLHRAWRTRTLRPVLRGLLTTIVLSSALYLWFAGAWGLNYSRTPIDAAIGYDASRVTPAALRALAGRATSELNRLHAAAHREGFPEIGDVPAPLVRALHEVERRLGRPAPTTPGRPKRTLLAPFFRASGVDGMHAPFLLETLLNPSLTPPERPAVLAHEWAHLAGYAPEADASFVGLLAALRGDAPTQYSAWLSLFDHAVGQLPAGERRAIMMQLAPGPTADRLAIAARLDDRVEVVARASWDTYDQYLKSQGVAEGVASYSRVVELLLASGALEWP
jgi:Zn-dependent protease with chaperone function